MGEVWFVAIGLATWLGAAGCGGLGSVSKACTLRGCQDQFSAKIRNTDGSVPQGMHTLEVTADGVTSTCAFKVPLDQVPGGGTAVPQCPIGLSVVIGQDSVCTEGGTDAAKFITCTPVPGHFSEDITLVGRPAQIHARLSVDGALVLDQTEAPVYKTSQPNGPGCDPICHQASAVWSFTMPAAASR